MLNGISVLLEFLMRYVLNKYLRIIDHKVV
jgi:hypothetical protein